MADNSRPAGWCFDCSKPVTTDCIDGEHAHQLAVSEQEYEAMMKPQPALSTQCEANAKSNEAGGYHKLAEECREYCRRGHPPQPALDTPPVDEARCKQCGGTTLPDVTGQWCPQCKLTVTEGPPDTPPERDHFNLIADNLEYAGFQNVIADGELVTFYFHDQQYAVRRAALIATPAQLKAIERIHVCPKCDGACLCKSARDTDTSNCVHCPSANDEAVAQTGQRVSDLEYAELLSTAKKPSPLAYKVAQFLWKHDGGLRDPSFIPAAANIIQAGLEEAARITLDHWNIATNRNAQIELVKAKRDEWAREAQRASITNPDGTWYLVSEDVKRHYRIQAQAANEIITALKEESINA